MKELHFASCWHGAVERVRANVWAVADRERESARAMRKSKCNFSSLVVDSQLERPVPCSLVLVRARATRPPTFACARNYFPSDHDDDDHHHHHRLIEYFMLPDRHKIFSHPLEGFCVCVSALRVEGFYRRLELEGIGDGCWCEMLFDICAQPTIFAWILRAKTFSSILFSMLTCARLGTFQMRVLRTQARPCAQRHKHKQKSKSKSKKRDYTFN